GRQHINEQWPDYWVQRFAQHDYVAIDALRPQVWNATQVECWYIQNLLLFVAADIATADPRLAAALARTRPGQLRLVHPRLFAATAEALEQLKGEVARHRSTAEHYMAASAESRAKAEAFFAELEQLKGEVARHRSTAEHYMAASAESRAKAEAFFAELEQLKGEVARHRSTAERYMAE